MKRWLGYLQVLLAGCGFGFLGVFGKLAFRSGLSIGELLVWRFVVAAGVLWVGLVVFRREWILLNFKQILICFLLGIFGYAVFSSLYFEAIRGMSVALAAMLLFTFPIYVSLGAHFVLKEKMSSAQILSLGLATLGMVVLLWGELNLRSWFAFLMGLAAAVTYAIYVLVSGKWQRNVRPLTSSLYVISAAAFGLFMIHRPVMSRVFSYSTHQLLLILGIAIVSTIGPLTLFLSGLQKLSSAEASVIVMIEPVVATVMAAVILNEHMMSHQYFGAGVVLLALLINSLGRKVRLA